MRRVFEENHCILVCQRFRDSQRYWCSKWKLSQVGTVVLYHLQVRGNTKWKRYTEENLAHKIHSWFFTLKWRTEVEFQLKEFVPKLVPMGTRESWINTCTLSQPVLTAWPKAHLVNHDPKTFIENVGSRGFKTEVQWRVQSDLPLSPTVHERPAKKVQGNCPDKHDYTGDRKVKLNFLLSSVVGTASWEGSENFVQVCVITFVAED